MSGQEQSPKVSVVVPTLNAARTLAATLRSVAGADEIVVVDGGSADDTREVARAHGAVVVAAARGRGVQMAAGVAAARHPWLLLLHADTRLAAGWQAVPRDPGRAGYFRLAFDSPAPAARRLERVVRWRARALGLPYGDQGLLISRALLAAVGGMRPLPFMEDVDLVRRLGRRRLRALDVVALTTASRHERDGWRARSARNALCLALYLLGVPPRILRRLY